MSARDERARRELRKVRAAYPSLLGDAVWEPAMQRLAVLRVEHRLAAARLAEIGLTEAVVPFIEATRRLAADCSRAESELSAAAREHSAPAPPPAPINWAAALKERRVALEAQQRSGIL